MSKTNLKIFTMHLQALNKLNRNWKFCTDTMESTGECRGLNVGVDCSRRNRISRSFDVVSESRSRRQAVAPAPASPSSAVPNNEDVYNVEITFDSTK